MWRCTVVALALAMVALATAQQLPRLNINLDTITVSGVSSGAAMATQLHVAYSKSIHGVGIFAGPPFYCAMDDLEIALSSCTITPALIDDDALIAFATGAVAVGSLDPLENIQDSRVWLFTGSKDSVVVSGVVDKTQKFYEHWVSSSNIKMVNNIAAEHSWVTDKFGNDCGHKGSPYINNCNFDAAGDMLKFLFSGKLRPRNTHYASSPKFFSTKHYVPADMNPSDFSLGDTFALYQPPQCNSTTSVECHLHVVFHGCKQDLQTIGSTFLEHSGLNEWADANNIVLLFPQAAKSPEVPYNPEGCWDWWGYSGMDYACKLAVQIQTIKNMIKAVTGSFGDD